MPENNDRLEHWREHLEDYVLVRNEHVTPSGIKISYLVLNIRKKMPYGIEDTHINQKLVNEMMEAGIKIVTLKNHGGCFIRKHSVTGHFLKNIGITITEQRSRTCPNTHIHTLIVTGQIFNEPIIALIEMPRPTQ